MVWIAGVWDQHAAPLLGREGGALRTGGRALCHLPGGGDVCRAADGDGEVEPSTAGSRDFGGIGSSGDLLARASAGRFFNGVTLNPDCRLRSADSRVGAGEASPERDRGERGWSVGGIAHLSGGEFGNWRDPEATHDLSGDLPRGLSGAGGIIGRLRAVCLADPALAGHHSRLSGCAGAGHCGDPGRRGPARELGPRELGWGVGGDYRRRDRLAIGEQGGGSGRLGLHTACGVGLTIGHDGAGRFPIPGH